MTQNTKEWLQYGSAIFMILTGVVLTFLCFFLNSFNITTGVLLYVAQALVYSGGIYGISIYFRTNLGEFESKTKEYIDKKINSKDS